MASQVNSTKNLEKGFSHSSVGKESACNAGDLGSIPGSGRSPGEENGNPLQYFCLENPMDRGAWKATVHGVPRVGHDLATKPSPSVGIIEQIHTSREMASILCGEPKMYPNCRILKVLLEI